MNEVRELHAEIREHKRILQAKVRRLKALCKTYGIPLRITSESDIVVHDDKATSTPND